jgi:hypothetical protein
MISHPHTGNHEQSGVFFLIPDFCVWTRAVLGREAARICPPIRLLQQTAWSASAQTADLIRDAGEVRYGPVADSPSVRTPLGI